MTPFDRAAEALAAELSDVHGCAYEDDRERLRTCPRCSQQAVHLAARLRHEGLLVTAADVPA